MDTSSPPEVPEFRGKTLTPVSPRPVHIAEPSNIPVLENQIDPAFNETSAHINFNKSRQATPTAAHGNDDTGTEQDLYSTVQSGFDGTLQESIAPAEFDTVDADLVDDHSMSLDLDDDETSDDDLPAANATEAHDAANQSPVASLPALSSSDALPFAAEPAPVTTLEAPVSPTESSSALQDTAATIATQSEAAEVTAVIKPNVAVLPASQDSADPTSGGVNIQALLDNLSPPNATAAASPSDGLTSATSNLTTVGDDALPSSAATTAASTLPVEAELHVQSSSVDKEPATRRPAHEEHTASQPENQATVGDDVSSVGAQQMLSSPLSHTAPVDVGAPGTSSPAGPRLATPPVATFQQHHQASDAEMSLQSPTTASQRPRGRREVHGRRTSLTEEEDPDPQWNEETQKLWDDFLDDEHGHVTEGQWDRFPPHSRLFIGNLPSEKVSKRDVFHVFHRYGRLAQISIKQAYGFVQFYEADACRRALQAEQSHTIRGRRMHIEISKPQRNTRNEQGNNRTRQRSRSPRREQGGNRRSRSPDYSRGAGPTSPRGPAVASGRGGDRPDRPAESRPNRQRGDRGFPNRQDRDGYRPRRSPSPGPRGFRGGEENRRGRGRSHDRYSGGGRRSRSRSPPYRRGERYRSRSPVGRRNSMDDLDALLPSRRPGEVPLVQIIITDDVDRGFVEFVEKVFRDGGITTDVLFLSPRVDVVEVIKRLAVEGVLAVSRLTRQNQTNVKIPLQIFHQSGGQANGRFDEYHPQVPDVAVALVLQARQAQVTARAVSAPNPYATLTQAMQAPQFPPSLGVSLPSQSMPTYSAAPSNPDLSSLITSLDPASLQSLLGVLQQQHQQQPQQQAAPAPPQLQQSLPPSQASPLLPPDLASLMSSFARPSTTPQMPYAAPPQQPQPQSLSQAQPHQQQQQSAVNPYAALAGNPAFANNPNLASLLAAAGVPPTAGVSSSQQPPQHIPHPNQQQQMHQQQQQPLPPHMVPPYHQYPAAANPAVGGQPMPHLQSVMEQLSKWTK